MNRRLCFVVPRFGKNVAGGAETLVGELARRLSKRGDTVTVLTTCAVDNRTWANVLPSGVSNESNVEVHRFNVDDRDLEEWVPLQIQISEGIRISLEDQLKWLSQSVNSSDLYAYLAQHSRTYDAIFFAPYLFGTTFWGSLIDPKRSILIPCLHDESYAYLDVMGCMFRQTRGALFNAEAERRLAVELYGDIGGGEVGMGFEDVPDETLPSLTPYFSDPFPYVLYVGRKETGKNAHLLIDYFVQGKESGIISKPIKLVIVGGGSFEDLNRNSYRKRDDIIDLEHVSEQDKQRLIRHSLCLCQPSTNESFSIVLMEAWLLRVPVVVHARCPVTKEHCVNSGGGLYFGSSEEFSEVVKLLSEKTELRSELGQSGYNYVRHKYNWDAVLRRFDTELAGLLSVESGSRDL